MRRAVKKMAVEPGLPGEYQAEALEALDALLAGPLGGGLGAGELLAQFPVIRAALRQIRADLGRAFGAGEGAEDGSI